jgi:hypothetical protein
VINSFERCFIVVDGLDECHEKDGFRDELLLTLKELQKRTKANVLATSRGGIPRILEHFEEVPQVHIQASNSDIDLYLDDQIPRILPILGHRPPRPEPKLEDFDREIPNPEASNTKGEKTEEHNEEEPAYELSSEEVIKQEDPDHDSYNYKLHEDIKDAIRKVADGT